MRIAICDDSAAEAAQISALLTEHFELNGFDAEIILFSSGEALLDVFSPGSFDALFLDIYMDGCSGMEAARKIRELDPNCALIFVTISRKHALDAFAVHATTYILKPVTREAMNEAFGHCRSVFMKNARYIEVTTDRQSVRIPLSKIRYIEVDGRNTLLHTTSGTMKSSLTLDSAEELLSGAPFLRCHRAFIVNMNHIEAVLEQDIRLLGGMLVPLSRRSKADIRDTYGAFLTRRMFETV